MKGIFTGKHILITAGPTWVPLDKVRVITNVFKGNLGVEIVKVFLKTGANITLLFGPGDVKLPPANRFLRIIRYKYYDELLKLVKNEVKYKKYDIIIHSAAVADYVPVNTSMGKIKSGQKDLVIHFKPTIKIVDLIKRLAPHTFLVKFKLEVGLNKKQLLGVAYKSMLQSKADLIVANEFSTISKNHQAFIMDNSQVVTAVNGKQHIAKALKAAIAGKINYA